MQERERQREREDMVEEDCAVSLKMESKACKNQIKNEKAKNVK